ncbi:hypothetical protein LXL04_019949 [Taraxacum kok-saghyz]
MMRSIAGFRVIHETQKAKGKITVTIASFKEGESLVESCIPQTELVPTTLVLNDIATRFIACEIDFMNTPVSKAMIKNSIYVLSDTLAVEALQNMVQGLKVRNLPVVENGEVIALLDITKCLYDAIARTESAAEKGKAIVAAVEGWGLFELIKGLIKDLDGDDNHEMGEDNLKEAQNSVARLIQMLYNDDPREVLKGHLCNFSYVYYVGFADYTYGEKHIMSGGPKRLPFTIPSLIYNALKVLSFLDHVKHNLFKLATKATIEVLSMVPAPDLALRLYLKCAEAANDCDLEPLGYVVNETLRILIFLR